MREERRPAVVDEGLKMADCCCCCCCVGVPDLLPLATSTFTQIQRRNVFLGIYSAGCYFNPRLLLKRKQIRASSAFLSRSETQISTSLSLSLPYQSDSSCISADDGFVVVNFYHFVFIKEPEAEVARHLAFLEDLNIRGRIYLNSQGINAQYSGPPKDAAAYVHWLRGDDRFSDIRVQISQALNDHAFPKLKLRYKPSLVQMEGGSSHLPLLDSSLRATSLPPSEWRKRLEANRNNDSSHDSCILLDVRNGYEWDIGHFHGAQRPDVDCFRSTSFGLSQTEVSASDPLANISKEKTDILMYCTGGIRCDVYSTILRERGFQNLYTLEGGVSNYLKNEGSAEWVGNLFVFDSRLSLPPPSITSEAEAESHKTPQDLATTGFARCYICASQVNELRHRNCANLDCNLLFLCCKNCLLDLKGCCCSYCITAPRLRPVLTGNQRYQKWHTYRDLEPKST